MAATELQELRAEAGPTQEQLTRKTGGTLAADTGIDDPDPHRTPLTAPPDGQPHTRTRDAALPELDILGLLTRASHRTTRSARGPPMDNDTYNGWRKSSYSNSTGGWSDESHHSRSLAPPPAGR